MEGGWRCVEESGGDGSCGCESVEGGVVGERLVVLRRRAG